MAAPGSDRYAKTVVDQDIKDTLGELERKLHELERAVTAIGRGDELPQQRPAADGAFAAASEDPAHESRLIDEAIERDGAIERDETVQTAVSVTATVDASTPARPAQGESPGRNKPPRRRSPRSDSRRLRFCNEKPATPAFRFLLQADRR